MKFATASTIKGLTVHQVEILRDAYSLGEHDLETLHNFYDNTASITQEHLDEFERQIKDGERCRNCARHGHSQLVIDAYGLCENCGMD